MADNTTESMKDYEKELERSFRTINEGDIVSGSVIAVSEEEVTLDLNYYTQGIIKVENLSNDPDFNPKEQLQPGDVIEATVIKVDDGNGNIELSKKEANDVLAWDKLQEMLENETQVTVRIKESVPSGVVAFLEGIRAFIPASTINSALSNKTISICFLLSSLCILSTIIVAFIIALSFLSMYSSTTQVTACGTSSSVNLSTFSRIKK